MNDDIGDIDRSKLDRFAKFVSIEVLVEYMNSTHVHVSALSRPLFQCTPHVWYERGYKSQKYRRKISNTNPKLLPSLLHPFCFYERVTILQPYFDKLPRINKKNVPHKTRVNTPTTRVYATMLFGFNYFLCS